MSEGNFVRLCKSLSALDLFGLRSPQPSRFKAGGSIGRPQTAITAAQVNLPLVFDQAFALSLQNQFEQLTSVTSADAALANLDDEGSRRVHTQQAGSWFYKPNPGKGHFGTVETIRTLPATVALGDPRQQLLHIAGDAIWICSNSLGLWPDSMSARQMPDGLTLVRFARCPSAIAGPESQICRYQYLRRSHNRGKRYHVAPFPPEARFRAGRSSESAIGKRENARLFGPFW